MASCPLVRDFEIQRQAGDQQHHRIVDLLRRDPLPRADQGMPGLLPD